MSAQPRICDDCLALAAHISSRQAARQAALAAVAKGDLVRLKAECVRCGGLKYVTTLPDLRGLVVEEELPAPTGLQAPDVTSLRPGSGSTITLVACSKSKADGPCAAKNLYRGRAFLGARAIAEATSDAWFILSAKHGLLNPDAVVEPYDETLVGAPAVRRREWGARVARELLTKLGDASGIRIVILAGRNYWGWGLAARLQMAGARVELPLEGLPLGRQLSWLAAQHGHSPAEGEREEEAVVPPAHGTPRATDLNHSGGWASLSRPSRLWSAAECLAPRSPVPASRGLYLWYFDEVPGDLDPDSSVRTPDGWMLLYAGIAPSRPASGTNLRVRIRQHFAGTAEGSTLRLTLGVLLAPRLGLRLQRVGATRTFGAGESALSAWMAEHARVAWIASDAPWDLEREVINQVDLPLNLQQNSRHPFHPTLSALRREARRDAGG